MGTGKGEIVQPHKGKNRRGWGFGRAHVVDKENGAGPAKRSKRDCGPRRKKKSYQERVQRQRQRQWGRKIEPANTPAPRT